MAISRPECNLDCMGRWVLCYIGDKKCFISFDVVQCVPTRKGHQILYKGYTYVFKSEENLEWVSIYFAAIPERQVMKCNLCEIEIPGDGKAPIFYNHMKEMHKDIYDLHKDNPEASVGFRVEFLHLNILKDEAGVQKQTQPVYLSEVSYAPETEVAETQIPDDEDVINMQYVMLDTKRKYTRKSAGMVSEQRKRSWIWKYFDKLSNIIYRCNICNVVLSIKGCNTNNLNRHMRSRHPESYKNEKFGEMKLKQEQDSLAELLAEDTDAPHAIATEEIYASNNTSNKESPSQKLRRSWIWSYFDHVSDTQAQCKLCQRQINHGGNATGNMNRHLKMIHHKTARDNNWVWKVFEREPSVYTCKICQVKLTRTNLEGDIESIMFHLKKEHGVISGDQIITGTEGLDEN